MAIYPTNDDAFIAWLTNFITVATANSVALSLSDGDLDLLADLREDLQRAVAAERTASDAAKAATATKQVRRTAANVQASFRAKVITANPNIAVGIKEQLGLNVPTKPVATPPMPPVLLSVAPKSTGVNVLTWGVGANTGRVTYLIEQKRSQSGAWTMVGAATTRTFSHAGQVPGRHVIYRVRTQKAGLQSDVSNDAVAYGDAAFPSHDNGITE